MEEGGQMCVSLLTMHDRNKASWWRQCGGLLGHLGSCG